jgi:lantibiotic modifying enzyme
VLTGKAKYRRMTEAAVAEALSIHRLLGVSGSCPGGFEGSGGLGYALALLGDWFGRRDWLRTGATIIRSYAEEAAKNNDTDLISGRAGFLACGTAVATIAKDASVIAALRPCAESLAGLPPDLLPADKEAGLAHGKAGVALALARWSEISGARDAKKAALALLREDLHSRPSEIAPGGHDGRRMLAWCRGGVGTALAAMRLGLPVRRETEKLLRSITGRMTGIEGDYALCLCHGLFGILEFLDEAARANVPGAREALQPVRREAVSRVLGGELCSDHAHRLESPGLMKGLAGTGYALLRLLHPETPSVLTLEPSQCAPLQP